MSHVSFDSIRSPTKQGKSVVPSPRRAGFVVVSAKVVGFIQFFAKVRGSSRNSCDFGQGTVGKSVIEMAWPGVVFEDKVEHVNGTEIRNVVRKSAAGKCVDRWCATGGEPPSAKRHAFGRHLAGTMAVVGVSGIYQSVAARQIRGGKRCVVHREQAHDPPLEKSYMSV